MRLFRRQPKDLEMLNKIAREINDYEVDSPKPVGNKDAFDALLKAVVPPLENPPEEETSDEEPS